MPKPAAKSAELAKALTKQLRALHANSAESLSDDALAALLELREEISRLAAEKRPEKAPPEITLGRPDGIARYFAFCFVNRSKLPLASLSEYRTPGSGVYAIYYHGTKHPAYAPISGTETPIYVGKADPKEPFAESPEKQGYSLHSRLNEHAKSINRAPDLDLADFHFRSAVVQSGMQAAVEAFMIQLFRPIWNKEMKICFGIGKHGDSAETRKNKRSPWDTMHPGRAWADATAQDQRQRHEVESAIAKHFSIHGVVATKTELLDRLSL